MGISCSVWLAAFNSAVRLVCCVAMRASMVLMVLLRLDSAVLLAFCAWLRMLVVEPVPALLTACSRFRPKLLVF